MESVGAFFPDSEWDCFRRMFANEEHDYYSPQFLTQCSLMLGEEDGELNIATQFCSVPKAGENECMFYSLDAHNSNSQHISQDNSYSSNCTGDTVFNSNPGHPNYLLNYPDHVVLENNTCVPLDEKNFASFVPSVTDIVMEENVKLNEDVGSDNNHSPVEPIAFPTKQLQLKRKLVEDQIDNRSENQKKKARVLKDGQGCMKNARSKKNQKLVSNGEESEETNNTGSNGQSSSSNISEDDNASQENSGGATSGSKSALNSNGKTRASRGSATDPQSLYARKRRERINERLRILQNLVPNGTKVDISTMLEEAVNYVKFLQLQIKLLSSDDLWMYAPLAYNGLDIGLNLNMKSSLPL